MKSTHWLSSNYMTVGVAVDPDTGKIIDAAPIVRKFVGQPLRNLINWMSRQGGLRIVEMKDYHDAYRRRNST